MVSCIVDWLPCEPSFENIIHNLQTADVYKSLVLVTMIIDSYYDFFGNQCSPYDVEMELRKLGLDIGLIAVDWANHPVYKKMVENNGGKVVLRKNHEQVKYLVIISCKKRYDVIVETLEHHESMHENLCCLKESGELLVHLTNKYDEFHNAIQHGTLSMQLNLCSYQTIFERVVETNPSSQIVQANKDLYVIVKDGIIICPIALQIQESEFNYVFVGIKK
uniref:Uncharacterized protein n=1 Tax=viral metagenome TaxID=1070528 RepID=A0A6C0CA58_9ZZZZ